MIVSIKHRGLKRWFYKEDPSGLTPHLVPIIDDILARLNVAEDVKAMSLPGWNLHPLKGKLKGFWSVKSQELAHYFSFSRRQRLGCEFG